LDIHAVERFVQDEQVIALQQSGTSDTIGKQREK
jgi:hypothetical protein